MTKHFEGHSLTYQYPFKRGRNMYIWRMIQRFIQLVMLVMKAEQEAMPKEENESESEICCLRKQLEAQKERNELLEKQNQELKQEATRLKMQLSSLRAQNNERKSMLWKKIQNSIDSTNSSSYQQKQQITLNASQKGPATEKSHTKLDFQDSASRKERTAREPNPPPRPASPIPSFHKDEKGNKIIMPSKIAPPPPPAPPKSLVASKGVRRVTEVIELYRSLTRKDSQMESRSNPNGIPAAAFTKNMIGEIENRSTYLSAIKSDVETHGEFIRFLIKEVESACYTDISDVEAFVKWLDGELSCLVDERAVLKHFPQWPEQKADAMREAACTYRDLKSLEYEVSSSEDNPKEPTDHALRRIQTLQDRLERCVCGTERIREDTSKRYRNFQIPWEWMLDSGLIGQMKLSSLKLAQQYMKRISMELKCDECFEEDNFMLKGVRFAFRVHQFAGGFDKDTIQAFRELKEHCSMPKNNIC